MSDPQAGILAAKKKQKNITTNKISTHNSISNPDFIYLADKIKIDVDRLYISTAKRNKTLKRN